MATPAEVKEAWHIFHLAENRNHGYNLGAQMQRKTKIASNKDQAALPVLACFSHKPPLFCKSFDAFMFSSTVLINNGSKHRSIAIS